MARFLNGAYDLMLEHNGRVLRVQIKCTQYKRGNSFKCHVSANGIPYRHDQVDFIAAYVITADVWYIIPVRAQPPPDILPFPHRPNSKYSRYQEVWRLLRGKS